MRNIMTGVLILMLVLTTACQHQSAQGVTTERLQNKIESASASADYPGIQIESKIVEYEDFQYAFHFPKIESEKWNVEMERLAEERINEFKLEIEELGDSKRRWPYELHMDFEIYNISDTFMSVRFNESKFLGGAHTEEKTITYNFNREDEQFVTLSELFKVGSNYLDVLSGLSYEKLMEFPEIEELVWDEHFQSGIDPVEENFQQFVIEDETLIIFFQRYQVGPNSIGSPEIQLKEEDLNGILTGEYVTTIPTANEEVKLNITLEVPNVEKKIGLDPNKMHVAITFDDGPHQTVTPKILDQLAEYDAQATFFVLGNRVEFHPDLLMRMKNEGHEIGNHTWSHPQLTNLSQEEIMNQLEKTDEQIAKIVGEKSALLRPPYGAVNGMMMQYIDHRIINWSVNTKDWQSENADSILHEVQKQVFDGSIILMHDIYPSTAEALGNVLTWLDTEGYQVVTVSQLLGFETDEGSVEVGKVYSSQ